MVRRSDLSEKEIKQATFISGLPLGTEIFAFSVRSPVAPIVRGEASIIQLGKDRFGIKAITKAKDLGTGSEALTISKQIAKDVKDVAKIPKGTNIGVGESITFRETPQGTESIISAIAGGSRKLGKVKIVRGTKVLEEVKDVGIGFSTQSASKDILKTITKKGISTPGGRGISESEILKEATRRNRNIIGSIEPPDVQGVIRIRGTTVRPEPLKTVRPKTIQDIRTKKFLDLSQIDIKASFGKFPSDVGKSDVIFIKRGTGSTAFSGRGFAPSLVPPKQIIKQTAELSTLSAEQSIRAVEKSSSAILSKEKGRRAFSVTGGAKLKTPTISSSGRTQTITQSGELARGRFDVNLGVGKIPSLSSGNIPSLGGLSTRFKPLVKQTSKIKSAQKSRQRLRLKQELEQENRLLTRNRLRFEQRLRLRGAQRLRLRGSQTRPPPILIPNIRIPPTRIPGIPLLPPFAKSKRKKRKKGVPRRPREDVIISQGFSAKQLKLKPLRVKASEIPRIARQDFFGGGLPIRRGAIIVPDIPRNKRRRRKRKDNIFLAFD